MTESYTVKLNYRGEDGYWIVGHEATIDLDGDSKDKHAEAAQKAKQMFKECYIVSVKYQ
jgi:hypothetical protein